MDYKNWKSIPIPEKMKEMEFDPRGYPIPFVILRGNNKSYFQVNDERKVNEAIEKNLCAICGKPMEDDTWLVGGPLSAFHPHGAYIDTCTHQDCLHYALKVCPYLAVPNYKKRIDMSNVDVSEFEDSMFFQDPTQDEERVPFFVAVHVTGFRVSRPEPGKRYLHPNRDYRAVEFWNDGKEITREEAVELLKENQKNPKSGIK